jgi:hypothetical protein
MKRSLMWTVAAVMILAAGLVAQMPARDRARMPGGMRIVAGEVRTMEGEVVDVYAYLVERTMEAPTTRPSGSAVPAMPSPGAPTPPMPDVPAAPGPAAMPGMPPMGDSMVMGLLVKGEDMPGAATDRQRPAQLYVLTCDPANVAGMAAMKGLSASMGHKMKITGKVYAADGVQILCVERMEQPMAAPMPPPMPGPMPGTGTPAPRPMPDME